LLQLHKLTTFPGVRPQPAFEIVPSANFSVRLTKAVTKVFKAKHGLCPNDLVVLRAEKYSSTDAEEDEEQEARHVIGLICKGRKEKEEGAAVAGKAKICLISGQEWEAYPLMNGGYEFFSTDEHGLGLTVRWVPKKNKDGSKSRDDKRFNFSTISPNSRRHPVIAALSRTSLEINDRYKMPDPAAVTPLSTPKQGATILADTMEEDAGGNEQCQTDDRLREVITMTAIWVTFKEGWSPSFKYDESKEAAAAKSPNPQNSPSKSIGSPLSTPPGSPSMSPLEKRSSVKSIGSGIIRKTSLLNKSNRSSQVSIPEQDLTPDELLRRSDSVKKAGRARGDSTSTVLVHRAASNRRKNNQAAAWRPDVLLAQHRINETSCEDVGSMTPPRAPAGEDDLLTPTSTPRKQSIAQPLLPSAATTAEQDVSPTSQGRNASVANAAERPETPEKRESTTTMETSSSGAPPTKSLQGGKTKRKGVWRRLLCGSSTTNDV